MGERVPHPRPWYGEENSQRSASQTHRKCSVALGSHIQLRMADSQRASQPEGNSACSAKASSPSRPATPVLPLEWHAKDRDGLPSEGRAATRSVRITQRLATVTAASKPIHMSYYVEWQARVAWPGMFAANQERPGSEKKWRNAGSAVVRPLKRHARAAAARRTKQRKVARR